MTEPKPKRHLSVAVNEGTLNRIRLPLRVVACWHLGDGAFDFDEKFIGASAKAAFDQFFAIRQAHPEAPVALFGHTDVAGKDDYNHELGAQRAQAVLGVLRGDPDLWYDLFAGDATSLTNLKQGLRASGYGGPTEEAGFGERTRAAVATHLAELSSGRTLDIQNDFLNAGKAALQSCGEFNPVVRFRADLSERVSVSELRRLNSVNRRVLAYFFEPETQVSLWWPCPVAGGGVHKCRKRFWSDAKQRTSPPSEPTQFWPADADGSPKLPFVASESLFQCRFYDRIARQAECELLDPPRPPPPPPPPPTPDPDDPEPDPEDPEPDDPEPDDPEPDDPEPEDDDADWSLVVTCGHPMRFNSGHLRIEGPDRLEVVPPLEGDEILFRILPAEQSKNVQLEWDGVTLLHTWKTAENPSVRIEHVDTVLDHPFTVYARFKALAPSHTVRASTPDGESSVVKVLKYPAKKTSMDGERLLDHVRECFEMLVKVVRFIGEIFSDDFEFTFLEDDDTTFDLNAQWKEWPRPDEPLRPDRPRDPSFLAFFAYAALFKADPIAHISGTIEFSLLSLLKRLRRFDALRKPLDKVLEHLPEKIVAALDAAKLEVRPTLEGGGVFMAQRNAPNEPILVVSDREGAEHWEFPFTIGLELVPDADLAKVLDVDKAGVEIRLDSEVSGLLGLIADMERGEFGFYHEWKFSGLYAQLKLDLPNVPTLDTGLLELIEPAEYERRRVILVEGTEEDK